MQSWRWSILLLFCWVDCYSQVSFAQAEPAQSERAAKQLSPVLRNMPMNSEKRCVGISAVCEALLDGKRIEGDHPISVKQLASSIYANLAQDQPVEYPSQLMIKRNLVTVSDPAALEVLATHVTELYKAEHHKIARTWQGTNRILSAERKVMRSEQELNRSLDVDPDRIVCFCCFGTRQFPDDTIKTTYHAVLIGRSSEGSIVVYDPNEPGEPLACKFYVASNGLTIEWACRYRDTGQLTTQRYKIVPMQRFFRVIRGLGQQ